MDLNKVCFIAWSKRKDFEERDKITMFHLFVFLYLSQHHNDAY